MMKMYLGICFFVLSACSTSSVQNEDQVSPVSDSSTEEAHPLVDKSIPEIKREEKIEISQYGPLDDAIRGQNDDGIQKTAGELLTQNSKDLKALSALAMVYYKRARYDAAYYLINKAISANPNSADAYSN